MVLSTAILELLGELVDRVVVAVIGSFVFTQRSFFSLFVLNFRCVSQEVVNSWGDVEALLHRQVVW